MFKNVINNQTTKEFSENGQKYRMTVDYGFHSFPNQEPYFSITADIDRWNGFRWVEDSGGCLHEEISKQFPELEYLIKWYLCSLVSGPMHYVANAVFWWEQFCLDSTDEKSLNNFKHTIVYGTTPFDNLDLAGKDKVAFENDIPTLRIWLDIRKDAMLESMFKDMREAGLIGMRKSGLIRMQTRRT
jgi:hypothetical protein